MNQPCLEVAPTVASSAGEIPLTVKERPNFLESVRKRYVFGLSESRFPISA